MTGRPAPNLWWQLTPVQRALLRRLWRDGPLLAPSPWEMRTVRSLLRRGLLRTRDRGRDRAGEPGSWFLTARATRLVAGAAGATASERAVDAGPAASGER